MAIRLIYIIGFIFSLLLQGCSKRDADPRLHEIENIVSDRPKEALQRLDSIDIAALSGGDRHLYDFLRVKAQDKAYIYHTSDSLILDVIGYYQSHDKEYYPEALYYGGRVYSDLGDYPTALQYFRSALEELPSDTKDLELKCRILSQTGRLLNTLRLYGDAVSYIEKSIQIGKEQNDTVGMIYDLQLLGGTYLRARKYDLAEKSLREAMRIGEKLPKSFEMESQMYLAEIKYETGQLDSALALIRTINEREAPKIYNSVLGYASNIYLKAGILDTAYMYANKLIHSDNRVQKEIGYQVILSPKLRGYLSQDSLDKYISNYRGLLENYLNHNEHQLAITQQARYNYELHEKARVKAETRQKLMTIWLIATVIGFIVVVALVVLYLKNRAKDRIIQLQVALDNLSKQEGDLPHTNPTQMMLTPLNHPNEQDLRERLRKSLLEIVEKHEGDVNVSSLITNSDAYGKLQEMIRTGSILRDKDNLWKELEDVVLSSSPDFKKNLNLLTEGKLKRVGYCTALLIKCGVRPSEMLSLFNITNGAIISRRENLSIKMFDKKIGVRYIDNVIRTL